MGTESAFDKKLAPETGMDKVEGLLEHLNLPTKVIDFIRVNQRVIQIVIAVVIAVVVVWSLYGSYQDKMKQEASTALSLALAGDEAGKTDALLKVVSEYSSTSSALWAQVELAHQDMKNASFADAATKYQAILDEIDNSNPLYSLVLFSLAQAMEADKRYGEASGQYDLLKEIQGYELIGYTGMARLEEAQGNIDKAVAIYNNFLLTLGDDPAFEKMQSQINAKIARIKARQ